MRVPQCFLKLVSTVFLSFVAAQAYAGFLDLGDGSVSTDAGDVGAKSLHIKQASWKQSGMNFGGTLTLPVGTNYLSFDVFPIVAEELQLRLLPAGDDSANQWTVFLPAEDLTAGRWQHVTLPLTVTGDDWTGNIRLHVHRTGSPYEFYFDNFQFTDTAGAGILGIDFESDTIGSVPAKPTPADNAYELYEVAVAPGSAGDLTIDLLGESELHLDGNISGIILTATPPGDGSDVTVDLYYDETVVSVEDNGTPVTQIVLTAAGGYLKTLNVVPVNIGSTAVYASGFPSNYSGAEVAFTVSSQVITLTPAKPELDEGEYDTLTVGLATPAPAGGLAVTLSFNENVISIVPATAVFAEGETEAEVRVEAIDTGTDTVTATATGWEAASAEYTVKAPLVTVEFYYEGNPVVNPRFRIAELNDTITDSASAQFNLPAGEHQLYYYGDFGPLNFTTDADGNVIDAPEYCLYSNTTLRVVFDSSVVIQFANAYDTDWNTTGSYSNYTFPWRMGEESFHNDSYEYFYPSAIAPKTEHLAVFTSNPFEFTLNSDGSVSYAEEDTKPGLAEGNGNVLTVYPYKVTTIITDADGNQLDPWWPGWRVNKEFSWNDSATTNDWPLLPGTATYGIQIAGGPTGAYVRLNADYTLSSADGSTNYGEQSPRLLIGSMDGSDYYVTWSVESPNPALEGDANGDCKVNIIDLIFIRNRLNQNATSGDNATADVNSDGKINIIDLIYVRNRLNDSCE